MLVPWGYGGAMTTVVTSVTVPRHLMDVHIDLTVCGVNMRFGNDTC